jgi:hypothetical protein
MHIFHFPTAHRPRVAPVPLPAGANLPTLRAYIQTHGHLPLIPTAADVAQNGIPLAEMNRLLLEKIEELTLYVLQLEKRLTEKETTR